MTLTEKLEAIKYCIERDLEEDAQEHIFDLLRGLRLKKRPDELLTPGGLELKRMWDVDGVPNSGGPGG